MALKDTYRRILHEKALDQYGYITTRDADELGVPAVELPKLHQRGGLEHVAYGLYRFEDIPPTSRDQFMEAVLRVGQAAVLAGDAVLALHDLGLANPRKLRVAAPKRERRALPEYLEVEVRDVPEKDRTVFEGIPVTTVARAILDCRGLIMGERLNEAVLEATRRGLLRKNEAGYVLHELEMGT